MDDVLYISAQIRLAKGNDLLLAQGVIKFDQPYYVLNDDLETFSGVHVTDIFHSYEALKELFKKKRIYVPITNSNDYIDYRLKQVDLKGLSEKSKIQSIKN
ncbi:hypothetical protein [Winogradskyella sp.]|uniref:hypothetical protein n=1 Tax=Winogradskyella sp. TaxID=1883156 RepID=UPI003BA89902